MTNYNIHYIKNRCRLNGLGVWSATDVGDLEHKVKQYIHPYKVRSFEFMKNRPHSLTSFK